VGRSAYVIPAFAGERAIKQIVIPG
jgi:hypothetical protein